MATKRTSPKRKPARPARSPRAAHKSAAAAKAKPARAARAVPAARERHAPADSIVRADDVRTILFELARVLVPADLRRLMNREQFLRERANSLGDGRLELLRSQMLLALECIDDHLADRSPQIPYFTVAILGAAVSYFSEALDIIPDFLPRIGRLDDALVMAVAYQVAEDGIRRYCEAKGLQVARFIA